MFLIIFIGKACGYDKGYEDYKFIYWAKPLPGNLHRFVCVKSCPATALKLNLDCKPNSVVEKCKYK